LTKVKVKYFYIFFDLVAAVLAWTIFYIYRRSVVEPEKYGYSFPLFFDDKYLIAIVLIPIFWVILYFIFGSYIDIVRKSRLRELSLILVISFIGSLILFFFLLLDDEVRDSSRYRYTFIVLFTGQTILTMLFRMIQLTYIKNQLKNRKFGFKTLLIGNEAKALDLYKELENDKYSQGYFFEGYVQINGKRQTGLDNYLTCLGTLEQINSIISHHQIEDVILAVESSEHHLISNILTELENENVKVKVQPDVYDILTGSVKMTYIFGTALIEVRKELMPPWQENVKRIIDLGFSSLFLVLFSPFLLFISLMVKLGSKGPIIYKQIRIGKNRKQFYIYKFRSMYVDAESMGPQLSSENDPRITKWGKIMRKYRIDEFPQFYNVIKGDMSLVGPRPERQYFIDKITNRNPEYYHLLKVKPGITSWGQIKYGYAENVDEMIQRMRFDLLYVENMTLAMDIKILFYTVLIMVQGRGK